MIAKEENVSPVPLCPIHFTEMVPRVLRWRIAWENDAQESPSRCCQEAGCSYTFTLSSGYFRFHASEPIQSEMSLRSLCKEHRRPLYIASGDAVTGTASWRCPERGCRTSKTGTMPKALGK